MLNRWTIAALCCLLVPLVFYSFCRLRLKWRYTVTLRKVLFFGVALSAFSVCMPYYLLQFATEEGFSNHWTAVMLSIQHALRLFAFDGEFIGLLSEMNTPLGGFTLRPLYIALGATLCLLAPLLTFTVLLSFLKNFTSKARYSFNFFRETHIFSDLNEKSLAMAKSLLRNRKFFSRRPLIVFTDILDKHEEEHYELIAEANLLNAVLFRKDLGSIHFRFRHLPFRKLKFYLISEDDSEKIRHATRIMERFDYRGAELYVFSDSIECQLLLSTTQTKHLRVTRVNDVQSLIYHNLHEHGVRLFRHARAVHTECGLPATEPATVSAVIVGLGQYGTEMFKALIWYCQMIGYTLRIDVFDEDVQTESRLRARCPELLDPPTRNAAGDSRYEIHLHSGIAVDTVDFGNRLQSIPHPTFVFVALGSDALNISTAIQIRALCEQKKCRPDIEAVVYDSNISKKMSMHWDDFANGHSEDKNTDGIKNHRGQAYRIHMIGDLESFYSADTLLRSALVEAGEECDLRWTRASLLNLKEELQILEAVEQIAQKADRFDPDRSLIYITKTDATTFTYSVLSVSDVYADSQTSNGVLSTQAQTNLRALIDQKAQAVLGDDTTLPQNTLRRFQLIKPAGDTVYISEDPINESLVFSTVSADPETNDDAGRCRPCVTRRCLDAIAHIYRRCLGIQKAPPAAKWTRESAKTFSEKKEMLREKIEHYQYELSLGRSVGFRTFEYNYRASIARAMRDELRERMLLTPDNGLPILPTAEWTEEDLALLRQAMRKAPEERSPAEMLVIGKLEHVAWNAYMRTEGLRRSEKTNMLAKEHLCLKPLSELRDRDIRKDA
ncbi:MAG: hypothetical protein E7666_02065 [Ruminococcaceae bacterium]|nr:hypothetical protein [Oscillospiraceae bacterium]